MNSVKPVSLFNLKPFEVPKASLYLGGALVLIGFVGCLCVGFDHIGFFANRNIQAISEGIAYTGAAFFAAPFLARIVKVAGVSALCWGCKKAIERGVTALNGFVENRRDLKVRKAPEIFHDEKTVVLKEAIEPQENKFKDLEPWLQDWQDVVDRLQSHLNEPMNMSEISQLGKDVDAHLNMLGREFSSLSSQDKIKQYSSLMSVVDALSTIYGRAAILESENVEFPVSPTISNEGSLGYVSDTESNVEEEDLENDTTYKSSYTDVARNSIATISWLVKSSIRSLF